MDNRIMLHLLRNPFGHSETELREVRLQAADELERLYTMEERIKDSIEKMRLVKESLDKE